ncbi:MAG: CHAP domain-containing protein [Bacteroidota bacterium]|nr:CHAP domain-containing protein [Bacteroidota bacterium]MDX5430850.1 CHAP domain-containing protein [Bacteroidota bacterium]MDX5469594.1 CHAP domain-containing protein [Bacteroidota bacterium]
MPYQATHFGVGRYMTARTKRLSFLLLMISGLFILTLSLYSQCGENAGSLSTQHEIGDRIDSLNGVYVYYNGSVSHVGGRNLAPDGYNLGLKYQCVEFVKRYYYEYYHHKMPDSYGHALSFFKPELGDGAQNPDRGLLQFKNGGSTMPVVGDLIVFDGNLFNEFGHVAIISRVDSSSIEIIQQNPGPSADSRAEIPLVFVNQKWKVKRSDCLGWLRKE